MLDFEWNRVWIQAEFQQKSFLRIGLAALIILVLLALDFFPGAFKRK